MTTEHLYSDKGYTDRSGAVLTAAQMRDVVRYAQFTGFDADQDEWGDFTLTNPRTGWTLVYTQVV